MGKKKDDARRKRRTREHIIADLGVHHAEGFVLRCGYTVQRIVHDYGLDLVIYTFGRNGDLENGEIYVQVKASDHLQTLKGEESIAWRLEAVTCVTG